jgi:hypothetical protein
MAVGGDGKSIHPEVYEVTGSFDTFEARTTRYGVCDAGLSDCAVCQSVTSL